MEWIAISGSWKVSNGEVEAHVRSTIREVFCNGYGIVSGGALGVDYIATDEALKIDPGAERIRIFLPTSLEDYVNHYMNRAKKNVIKKSQARNLKNQLEAIVKVNESAIITNPSSHKVNKRSYYKRIDKMLEFPNIVKLKAFHVNKTEGTKYTIDKAEEKGIPVEIHQYII